jgi:hypothetical protein
VWTTGITVPAAICIMQPRLPAADHVGLELFDIADFALAQPPRKLGWRML